MIIIDIEGKIQKYIETNIKIQYNENTNDEIGIIKKQER